MDKKLKKKRKMTTIIYYIISFMSGIDISCVAISLIFYLKNDVHVTSAKNISGYIMGMFAASTSLIGIFAGRVADRTREVKKTVLFMLFTSATGNLIYTFGNIWFILLGRALCGCIGATNGILSGELSKSYSRHEFSSIMFIFQTCHSIGFIIGPVTAGMFTSIRFSIGDWKITPNNFVGIFLAVTITLLALLLLFLSTDVSKEYREQKYEKLIDSNDSFDEDKNPSKQQQYKELTFLDVVTDYGLMVVMLLSASISYLSGPNELLINMIGIYIFKFDLKTMSIITAVGVFLFMVILLLVLRKLFSTPEKNVVSYIICVFSITIACWFFMLPKLIAIDSNLLRYVFVFVPIILNAIAGLSNYSLARQILFRLVPENSACFTEGIRVAICKTFSLTGFLLFGVVYSELSYVMPCIMCIILFILFLFFRNRELYIDLNPSLKKYEI